MSTVSSNSSKMFIRQMLSIFIQLDSIVIIARGLGVEGNSHYALAILLPTLVANLRLYPNLYQCILQ